MGGTQVNTKLAKAYSLNLSDHAYENFEKSSNKTTEEDVNFKYQSNVKNIDQDILELSRKKTEKCAKGTKTSDSMKKMLEIKHSL